MAARDVETFGEARFDREPLSRWHSLKYHGVLAGHAKARAEVVPGSWTRGQSRLAAARAKLLRSPKCVVIASHAMP